MKEMKLADWPIFQDKFAEMQIAHGTPADFALFYRNHHGIRFSTIAASGLDLARAHALTRFRLADGLKSSSSTGRAGPS